MNTNTIPMPEIIARLAQKVNCGNDTSADFLKEFSAVITQGLDADGIVKIEGLGIFKVVSDVDDKPTADFAPQVSLAEFVNEPFAIFESVELADSVTDEELQSTSSELEQADEIVSDNTSTELSQTDDADGIYSDESKFEAEQSMLPPPLPERFRQHDSHLSETIEDKEPSEAVDEAISQQSADDNEQNIGDGASIDEVVDNNVAYNDSAYSEPSLRQSYETPVPVILEPESRVTIRRVGHTTLTLVVTAVAACLLGLVIGYFAYKYVNFGMPGNVEILENGILIRHSGNLSVDSVSDSTVIIDRIYNDEYAQDEIATEVVEDADSIVEVITRADEDVNQHAVESTAVQVVTDTVRPGNYLSVMARRHYGNAKFWVYIYLENKDKIKNPDNLENGMVLVIPPREKYGINPSDSESLKKAEREAYKATPE